jgi:hypothetical protein
VLATGRFLAVQFHLIDMSFPSSLTTRILYGDVQACAVVAGIAADECGRLETFSLDHGNILPHSRAVV